MKLFKIILTFAISLLSLVNCSNSNVEIENNMTIPSISLNNESQYSNYNPFIVQSNNIEIQDFNLFFISYSIFYSLIFGTAIYKNYYNLSLFTRNSFLNLPKETIIFGSVYLIWWLSLFVYCFLTTEKNEILFRQGQWVTLNMGSVLTPVTRNSIWLILFRISYDHILHLHKYLAILCFISVWVKLITVVVFNGFPYLVLPLNMETGGSPLMGTLSSLSIITTVLLAIPLIRNRIFELFYYSHRILAFVTIITGSLHYLLTLYYLILPFTLYLIDLILRYVHTHKAIYSHLKIVGEEKDDTSCVFIHITLLKKIKVNYGSYFFICFKDISRFQLHPLSLISEHNENLIFCAKDRGKNTWTNKLKMYDSSSNEKILMNKDVYLQGPYGHVTINYEKNKYKFILGIAGGIGITPIISVLQNINYLFMEKKLSNLQKIVLIWVASHKSLVKPFLSLFHKLSDIFEINIYITRGKDVEHEIPFKTYFERPKISNLIHAFIDDFGIVTTDMAVLNCGPESLSKDIIKTCSELNIDISNENF